MMVLQELLMSYFGLDTAELSDPASRNTVADFVRWEEDYLRGEAGQAALKQVTAKMERTRERINLPVDRQRDATPCKQFGRVVYGFSKSETAKIRRFAQRHSVSVFSATLAGFGKVVDL